MIARLQFHRAPKRRYIAHSPLHITIALTSEFNDPLNDFPLLDLILNFRFIAVDSREGIASSSLTQPSIPIQQCKAPRQKSGAVVHYAFYTPEQTGKYILLVRSDPSAHASSMIRVLDVASDVFEVVAPQTLISSTEMPLLSNFRVIKGSTDPSIEIVVKEDYGSTMGAHVYDSAVVLGDYLSQHKDIIQDNVIIELGAGCGLVSLFALQLAAQSVISTDLLCQLPLLQANVQREGVRCLEFCWGNQQHFQALTKELPPQSNLVLLAADVLYDAEAAVAFIHVVQAWMATSQGQTVCLVAQRLRDDRSEDVRKSQWESVCSDLKWTIRYQGFNVIIWQIEASSRLLQLEEA